jgi:hypothetical protein
VRVGALVASAAGAELLMGTSSSGRAADAVQGPGDPFLRGS